MSKRLILFLALAFVVGVTAMAFAEVQNIKVSGDVTMTGIMRGDFTLINNDAPVGSVDSNNWTQDKQQYFLRQARLRVDADLTDNVSATVRLLSEGDWGSECIQGQNENDDEVYLDLAYATMKEFLYSPATLSIGRQELMFGNAMVVGDPDTNGAATGWGGTAGVLMANTTNWYYMPAPDLSQRKAFDSIKVMLDYDPLVITGIYAKIQERDPSNTDDETLYGINAAYDFQDALKTMAELYYFVRHRGEAINTTMSKSDRVQTIGIRVKTEPMDKLTVQAETAYQFGVYDPNLDPNSAATTPMQDRNAWAAQIMASYELDMKYDPVLSAVFAAFSGEHDNTASGTKNKDNYTGWDPMYESQTFGRIHNAIFAQTNQYILGGGVKVTPMEDVTLGLDMYNYWLQAEFADRETTILNGLTNGYVYRMSDERYLGKEFDLSVIYDYTEDVQFALMADWFIPGKAFNADQNNSATELIGSMKVTF